MQRYELFHIFADYYSPTVAPDTNQGLVSMMKYEKTADRQIAKENGRVLNVFNLFIVTTLLTVFALPSDVYAQCKTVTASTMSICASSDWEVEIENDDEDNTASIYLTSKADDVFRTYVFMDLVIEAYENLDDIVEVFMEEALDDAKWGKVTKTTFQSRDARQVSGVTDVNGIPLYVTILVFNGGNGFSYVILVCDVENIGSLQNDEIIKSFRIVKK